MDGHRCKLFFDASIPEPKLYISAFPVDLLPGFQKPEMGALKTLWDQYAYPQILGLVPDLLPFLVF